MHNQTYEKVINDFWIDGSDDGEIDAISYDDSQVCAYQIKLGKLDREFINVVDDMKTAFSEYREKKSLSGNNKRHLLNFLNAHFDRDLKSKSLYCYTISTNGRKTENILPKEVINLFLMKRFQRKRGRSDNAATFHVKERAILKIDKDLKEVFMFVNAEDFIYAFQNYLGVDLSEETLESLFVKNVRGKMVPKEATLNTLEKKPAMFSFYNNGVSIICEFNDQDKLDYFDLYNPIIINGQQTFFTVWKSFRDGKDLSKAFIPVFVKQAPKSETQNIAKYNNTQAKVSSIDLLSLDESLKKLQSEMLENIAERKKQGERIFFLQLTSSGDLIAMDNAIAFFGKENVISLSVFVKLYGTILSPVDIGRWKNSVNGEIVRSHPSGFSTIDIKTANKLCSVISECESFIKDNEFRVADLTVQYLYYKGFTFDEIKLIVEEMIGISISDGKTKADIFRKKKPLVIILRYQKN